MKHSLLMKMLFVFACSAGTISIHFAADNPSVTAAPAVPAAAENPVTGSESAVPAAAETAPSPDQPASPKEAKPEPFRQGLIYSAELSYKKPEIQDPEISKPDAAAANVVWAEIVVKCPEGRGLCRFDFSLMKENNVFPCLALAEQDEAYSQKKDTWLFEPETAPQKEQTYRKLDHTRFYRMLFAVPAELVTTEALQPFYLKFNYSFKQKDKVEPSQFKDKEVSFRLLPAEEAFSLVAAMPQNGTYGLTAEELKQANQPAPAPMEAVPAAAAVPAVPAAEPGK